ncbi:hypothetical protein SAMN05216489_08350 [Streptomyces sp. 3213]|nr:hypothetical protein [Streptomyces sp. 3213.3]SEE80044.1 hypothetical protein SAMN05216489_08350 [Streptomyces sp. 3213] [Streptomyces sp. 3213.3]
MTFTDPMATTRSASCSAWVSAEYGTSRGCVLLYFASQLLTVPALLGHLDVRRLLFFTIPLGFTAGFTFDLVFERLRTGAAGPPSVPPPDPLAPGVSRPPSADGPLA